jgi:hypothetical protein
MKRTPGLSNPVDPRRAFVEKMIAEEHAAAAVKYVAKIEQNARARSWAARVKRRLLGGP